MEKSFDEKMMTSNNPILSSFLLILLVMVKGASPIYAHSGEHFDFLLRFHPKVSTAMIETGGGYVERVQLHSLVFRPKQARQVLPELDKVLTQQRGWTRYVSRYAARKRSAREEYVIYKRRGTNIAYMSAHVYRHLRREEGTKLLPTPKGGCIVEYFHIHIKK